MPHPNNRQAGRGIQAGIRRRKKKGSIVSAEQDAIGGDIPGANAVVPGEEAIDALTGDQDINDEDRLAENRRRKLRRGRARRQGKAEGSAGRIAEFFNTRSF